jgi:hypothetical protein
MREHDSTEEKPRNKRAEAGVGFNEELKELHDVFICLVLVEIEKEDL